MTPARLVRYVATAAVVAFVVYALWVSPMHPAVVVSVLSVYLLVLTFGVVFARFGMWADVVSEGPVDATGVALTFDDGPDPESTRKILDMLDERGNKATFFVIGAKAERHPEIVREIHRRGHAIGVHSYRHDRLLSLRLWAVVRDDLTRSVAIVERLTGVRPTLFRAPVGLVSPIMARVARELGLATVGWSVRGLDGWAGATAELVAGRVTSGLRAGAIVLLHDASERDAFVPASVAALPSILDAAAERDIPLVRVDRWVASGSRPYFVRSGVKRSE